MNKVNIRKHSLNTLFTLLLLIIFEFPSFANSKSIEEYTQLPSVPYPTENPFTEEKRILGKILFWDEQLSTDNTMACGTCHMPSVNGTDKRQALFPGYDNTLNTNDDTLGSPGVVLRNSNGQAVKHPIFNLAPQATGRTAQPFFLGIWANSNFWDGRAQSQFIDPDTGKIAIKQGGALENQALGPLMSTVEMAKQGQTAEEVTFKLQQSAPLALASNFTPDIEKALATFSTYPSLFQNAFGDSTITLKRIAFAIATYERTLIADQTPWDQMVKNNKPLPYIENLGWEFFKQHECDSCHKPPLFTDNKFYNIGIQGQNADAGHQIISLDDKDIGAMKVPSLRNTGLKTNYMHTGNFHTLEDVIDAYAEVPFKNIASKLPNGEEYNFQFTEMQRKALIAFLEKSLTDRRVKKEVYPFDKPTLNSERIINNTRPQLTNTKIILNNENQVEISWKHQTPDNSKHINLLIVRSDNIHFWATTSPYIDNTIESGKDYQYKLYNASALSNTSHPIVSLSITVPTNNQNTWIIVIIIIMMAYLIYKKLK